MRQPKSVPPVFPTFGVAVTDAWHSTETDDTKDASANPASAHDADVPAEKPAAS